MSNDRIHSLSYQSGQWRENEISIITEKPVSLSVNGEVWLTFMCTPSNLEALAVGFLFNEEIIQRQEDIASIRVCPDGDNIDVWLSTAVKKPKSWIRTSGCSGGETTIEKIESRVGIKLNDHPPIKAEQVLDLINHLGEVQDLYKKYGGVHTSALSDGENILISAEDIGRHNTLDKLAGLCVLGEIHFGRMIVLTTGRVSSEMIQKSGRMGADLVISRTSPSSLSVQIAQQLEITLIGYARRDRFTIYTHPERILMVKGSSNINGEGA